jgi:hypothetical protein
VLTATDMHHLIPTLFLLPLTFWYSAKRSSAKQAFYRLCLLPLLLYLVAFITERLWGYGLAAHALFHFSYDTSYILTLIGLIVLLYLVLKKDRPFGLMLALLISVAPLFELLLY